VKGIFPANEAPQHEHTLLGAEETKPGAPFEELVCPWPALESACSLNSAAAALVSLSCACAFNIAWNQRTIRKPTSFLHQAN
jgi:hypothetical protein